MPEGQVSISIVSPSRTATGFSIRWRARTQVSPRAMSVSRPTPSSAAWSPATSPRYPDSAGSASVPNASTS